MSGIVLAAAVVGGTGLILGVFLGIAGNKFKVEVDEKVEKIRAELPGNNCGGCGYAGCDGLASGIAKGEAEVGACPVGGAKTAEKIAIIMGKTAEAGVHKVAFVKCAGTCEQTHAHYDYYGAKDCQIMEFIPTGGPKSCGFGCLGYGTCVAACDFDAIHILDGIAKVDKEKCKACGKCVNVCPKGLIELIPYDMKQMVQCASKDRGKNVMQACKTGCIGCKKCEKECADDAITVTEFLARIDSEKCTNCGKCAQVCPRNIIVEGF